MVKNMRRHACKFDRDQSERKSPQVDASARKAWPNAIRKWTQGFSLCLFASPFGRGLINRVMDSLQMILIILRIQL